MSSYYENKAPISFVVDRPVYERAMARARSQGGRSLSSYMRELLDADLAKASADTAKA